MSAQDVELLRRRYEAVNAGGTEATLSFLDDNIEIRVPAQNILAASGPFRGRDAVRRLLAERDEAFTDIRFRPERFVDLDGRVLVLGTQSMRSTGGGVELEATMSHLWTLRDGKAILLETYGSPEEALNAVGLAE